MWAGIMINGRPRLHVVANGTMTGQRYIDEVLFPHVRLFRGAVGDKFIFMDDNATCHRTLAVQDCLDSEGIQRLVWPARSPDLNPIENVWDALGRQVAGRNYPPTNKNTLIRALTEEWDKLPQQLLDKVVQTALMQVSCPEKKLVCADGTRCVKSSWICDGENDCPDGSDELFCATPTPVHVPGRLQRSNPTMGDLTVGNKVLNVPGVASARERLISLFKQRRKSGSSVDKWGSQLHRVAVALHLANEYIFSPGNTIGQEITYELTIQLLHRLSKGKQMSSEELALYIHAMMAACMSPRDFYGLNLVQELRKRTEANTNYTNPFQILVLCNSGDKMATRDVDRVMVAYDSQHRPFWTDTQALSSLALACLSTKYNLVKDERILKHMLQELKSHQFRNGTIDNLKTTSLVVQALLITDSFEKDFDVKLAL
ncbi:gastric intrinsic factor [Trichonephila clavipes]|nr:gastric intrinsic factor [Trichonephila clavipes]